MGDITTIFNPNFNRNMATSGATSVRFYDPPPTRDGKRSQSMHSESHRSFDFESVQASPMENKESSDKKGGCVRKMKNVKNICCSSNATKIYFGFCVTICITILWVSSTHVVKYLYHAYAIMPSYNYTRLSLLPVASYNAPFFTTWFMMNWCILFFPVYCVGQLLSSSKQSPRELFAESWNNFKDIQYSTGQFLIRCWCYTILWFGTNYMYVRSLRVLLATDAIALFATNVAFFYILSWVVLHEQFVGLRIMAVILCNTGVALLAYMDGLSRSPTLNSVVLATSSALGLSVYKVFFKKMFGIVSFGQLSLFYSIMGFINGVFLWTIFVALYFSGSEIVVWDRLPWTELVCASVLLLANNLLASFSTAVTYDLFITLGLITAVPISAALDIVLYDTSFQGMKLAGIILISIAFFLVMFPDNWPDYITRLLRMIILLCHNCRCNRKKHGTPMHNQRNDTDYRTGYIRSHLRSPSGRVR